MVRVELASPGVGGGVVLPLSVSVGLALELLLSDVLIGVEGNKVANVLYVQACALAKQIKDTGRLHSPHLLLTSEKF